ncbi:DEAD/DEAH box helicase family protein [Prevotella corporis]|uniref:restriction endonuclease n=1 Tax=Prevotella corporis TaxID=28128 RepID=UPI0027E41667|nr:DEAD/DEAH box helicase family protein [Prevotella corporis]MDQ7737821.1 DEAD/DEAH box helicase family protein [Prevotella corporis]
MKFRLESPEHQIQAIKSVVSIFDGLEKNIPDNAQIEDIYANVCSLRPQQIWDNIHRVAEENGITEANAHYAETNDVCIEMETGTGKTLTYLQTAYELYKEHGFTKFVIIVPSVPIRQGVIDTFENFKEQLDDKYGFTPNAFVYDSSRLSKLRDFITQDYPQIMILTMASFNSEDNILNRKEQENLLNNLPHIESLGRTHPIIFMDEPQEGMDTDNSIAWLAKMQPLFKIRYSATHKVKWNTIYRLTPAESYRLGLVKKIEVLTVAEKNDEATMKIELSAVQETKTEPKVKLKYWKLNRAKDRFEFKESGLLKKDDNLAVKSGNDSYADFNISRIYKQMSNRRWKVVFSNGTSVEEKQTSTSKEQVWALQLEWLIRRHFQNKAWLKPQGIKNLSLIFIDRVANYMSEEYPVIKQLFEEKYKQLYPEYNNGQTPTEEQVKAVQGFYFAKTTQGEYTDNETSMKGNKEIYDQILHRKELLLSFDSPIEFIFSHSALGVGWDNPNIFGIATLNESYSENKKRQEIGRGLRICVNQEGQRVYDKDGTPEDDLINQLTIVPNETYETFAKSYQAEITEAYGTPDAGPKMKPTHKGKPTHRVTFKLNSKDSVRQAFRELWKRISHLTTYRVHFDEDTLVNRCIEAVNTINIEDYMAEVSMYRVQNISDFTQREYGGSENYNLKGHFTPTDFIEDVSEKTGLCYRSVMRIFSGINNKQQYVKNPPVFIERAVVQIRSMQLEELVRCVEYTPSDERYNIERFVDYYRDDCREFVSTPNHGLWDKTLYDSLLERDFARDADEEDKSVVCFLKFPTWYKIPTPIGEYIPDFGVVLKRKRLSNADEKEYYFVVEIKGTNDINDQKALTPHEVARIKCAIRHFDALGIDVQYKAPIKDFETFTKQTELERK